MCGRVVKWRWGTMLSLLAAGISEIGAPTGDAALDLGRGAIAGALIVGAAFLAGYAAIRRSGLAFCALIMVAMAAALEFSWLGLLPTLPAEGAVLILGLFAASAVIFLSASVNAAKYNPLLGGVMFTGALILGGLGFINFIDRVDISGLMRWGAIGVGAFAVILAVTQALRGDAGARLILPGVALAIAAPLIGPLGAVESAASIAAHGVFTLGILAASLVALTEGFAPVRSLGAATTPQHAFGHAEPSTRKASGGAAKPSRERAEVVIDSQLGRVLDYSGVGIWDWSPDIIDQTESLPALLGADSDAPFTPDAMRQFIHKDDLKTLETVVLAAEDGPFDVNLKLYNDRTVRIRGARAAAEDEGVLERIVAFIEYADAKFAEGAGASAPMKTDKTAQPNATFDVDNIVAAFQPIVSLKDKKTVGYEALARLDGKDGDTAQLIRSAALAGKSGEFARSMLSQAAEYLAQERKAKRAAPSSFVAMNVSWTQMRDPAFADAVAAVTKKYGLPNGALVLELTEGEAIGDAEAATPVFRKLKELGAALAFDDFGAGFSCLTNVRKYDFDFIKIDKSFADDLVGDGDGAKIVGALATMGRDLGLKVIIEGVESDEAAKTAAALGCTYGQGFAFGRPAAASRDHAKQQNDALKDKKSAIARPAIASSKKETPADAIELTPDLAAAAANDAKPMRWRPWGRTGQH